MALNISYHWFPEVSHIPRKLSTVLDARQKGAYQINTDASWFVNSVPAARLWVNEHASDRIGAL
jgi:hypothetical protein